MTTNTCRIYFCASTYAKAHDLRIHKQKVDRIWEKNSLKLQLQFMSGDIIFSHHFPQCADLLDDAFFHIQYCITQESIHNNQMDYGTVIDVVGKTICRWKNYSSDCERQRHSGVYYPRNPRGCTCTSKCDYFMFCFAGRCSTSMLLYTKPDQVFALLGIL